MKSYKYCGFLIVFLLLLFQYVSAQLPDFKKMTPQQIQDWQKKFIAEKTKGLANMDNLVLTPQKTDTSTTTVSFEYHEDYTSYNEHWVASIIGSSMAAPAFYTEGSDKIEVRTITSPISMGFPVDNKLTGNMTYSGNHSVCPASGRSTGIFNFYFSYDPVTKVGSIEGAAGYIRVLGGKCEKGLKQNYESEQNLKFGGHNDMTLYKIPGAANPTNPNDGKGFFKMDKVGSTYKITYNNTYHKGNETSIVSFTATIGFKPSTWEAVIYPVNPRQYPKWIPEGPKVDGSTDKGNSIKFKVVVRDKNDTNKIYSGDYTTDWQLNDVSKYPGYCSNYPEYTTNPDIKPDLRFEDTVPTDFESITDDHAKTKKDKGNINILIRSYDYASIGTLSANVTLEDGTQLSAINYKNKDKFKIVIPKDDNDNKIADEWEVQMGVFGNNYDGKRDEDDQMGQMRTGDGLSMFEEYRGFKTKRNVITIGNKEIENGEYVRTDPSRKDIFVYDPDDLIKMYYEAYNPANMCIHYIHKEEMSFTGKPLDPDNRWINFNYVEPYTYARQYVMCVKRVSIADVSAVGSLNTVGSAMNSYSLIHQPPNWQQIWMRPVYCYDVLEVSVIRARQTVSHLINWNKVIKAEDSLTVVTNLLSSTVIHEMGHYMGIIHHRFPENRKPANEKYNSTGTDDINPISGNVACPMRYGTYTEYMTRNSWLSLNSNYCRKNMTGFRVNCVQVQVQVGQETHQETHCDFTTEIITADDCWGQIDVKTDPR